MRNTAEVLDHDLEKGGLSARPSIIGHKKFSALAKQRRVSGQSGAGEETSSSSGHPSGSNEYYAIFYANDPIWRPILEDGPDQETMKSEWNRQKGARLRKSQK